MAKVIGTKDKRGEFIAYPFNHYGVKKIRWMFVEPRDGKAHFGVAIDFKEAREQAAKVGYHGNA